MRHIGVRGSKPPCAGAGVRASFSGRVLAPAVLLGGLVGVLLSGCGVADPGSGVAGQGNVGASVSRPSGLGDPTDTTAETPADGSARATAGVSSGASADAEASEVSTNVVPELAQMNVGTARLIRVDAVIGQVEPDLATTVAVERVSMIDDAAATSLRTLETVGTVALAGGGYVGVVKDTGRQPSEVQIFGDGPETEVRVVLGAESEEFTSTRCECDAVENPDFIERAWLVPLELTDSQAIALTAK